MDLPENHPSLIEYLESSGRGFFIDLVPPSPDPAGKLDRMGPFCKTLSARIVTDGGDMVSRVILIKQRDHYALPDSMVPVTNAHLERAWRQSLAFHRQTAGKKAPMMLKQQVGPKGDLQAFKPLFSCHETGQWFHPVCPQCGMPLTLCRDDALLQKRGLPAYTDSLVRFMVCGSCVRLSDASPFYCRDKTAGMPEGVRCTDELVAQWKQLLSTLPDEADLPCRGCPSAQACYGPDMLSTQRIQPWSFYPFFMLMFPAPSMGAEDFIRMVAGDGSAPGRAMATEVLPAEPKRFLFQEHERQFLEVLFLKLAFLEQVIRQLMPDEKSAALQEFDLSLDGIGIDMNPSGAGLPAYWSFDARIVDAVGSFRTSPFAPGLPVPSRLHFMGALWFRTLLVNSRQKADVAFAAVKQTVDRLMDDKGPENWTLDPSDAEGALAAGQIFWTPETRHFPEPWRLLWQQALRLGLQLVQAGLKTGASWDRVSFMASLASLRDAIQAGMFSAAATVPAPSESTSQASDRIRQVLSGILRQWQTNADGDRAVPPAEPPHPDADAAVAVEASSQVPPPLRADTPSAPLPVQPPLQPDENGWDLDTQETVILAAPEGASPQNALAQDGLDNPDQDSGWSDDNQATVVMQNAAFKPPGDHPASPGDVEKTVVISPKTAPPERPSHSVDVDFEATIVQDRSGLPTASTDSREDLEATVILNTGVPPIPNNAPLSVDDDLAATLVQGAGDRRPAEGADKWDPAVRPGHPAGQAGDLDATIVIGPFARQPSGAPPPKAIDDDLDETMIQTPRRNAHRDGSSAPPSPKAPVRPPGASGPGPAKPPDGDDDIMEQTIIIRSDVKKE